MTLTTLINKSEHTANGVAVDFAYAFRIDNADDLVVYVNGVVKGTGDATYGHSISGVGSDTGGTVTFNTAPPDQDNITLVRELDTKQEVDYQPYDPFPAETHEQALDNLHMLIQQLEEEISRTIQSPQGSDPGTSFELPLYDAGKAIMWDESTQVLTNSDDNINGLLAACQAEVSTAQAAASAASASASAASTSETNAATSASNALASENKANQWAEEPEDSEVETGEYSALHWAAKAAAEVASIYSTSNVWSAVQSHAKTFTQNVASVDLDFSAEPTHQILINQDITISISNWTTWDRSVFVEMNTVDTSGPYLVSWDSNIKWGNYADNQPSSDPTQVSLFWLWSDGSRVCGVKLADIQIA